jgi:DNA-binding transcriptional MerR regulator
MSALGIGDVASEVGVATSTIRYYEAIGLLPPAERENGRRRYARETVDLVLVIRFCQRMGFTLDEVREILASPGSAARQKRWHELVDVKLTELDAVIAQAQGVRRVLEASRDCDCVTLDACGLVRNPHRSESSGDDLVRVRATAAPGRRRRA